MSRKPKTGLEASVADRLIDAAEEIYGRRGLEGPSLREISLAAGTGNNYAVQYHFGDAAGLIQAILTNRAPRIEAGRARLLAKLKVRGDLTTRSLLEALMMPQIDCVNERGERAFARFMLALGSTPAGYAHLLKADALLPVAGEILDLLHELNSGVPQSFLRERVRLAAHMTLNSMFNRTPLYDHEALDAELIENALDMASAAISAPTGDYLRALARASAGA